MVNSRMIVGFGYCVSLLLVTSCASFAVTQTALEERTAQALTLKNTDFTITDRVDSGVRTDYQVHTKKGVTYSCYVTGTVTYTGKTVSDAICTGKGKQQPADNALIRESKKLK